MLNWAPLTGYLCPYVTVILKDSQLELELLRWKAVTVNFDVYFYNALLKWCLNLYFHQEYMTITVPFPNTGYHQFQKKLSIWANNKITWFF